MAGIKARAAASYKRLLKIIISDVPDADEFRRVLEGALTAGFPIDWQEEDGWTLLHYAVNILNAVRAGLPQVLINAGADVDARDNSGWTPLGGACRNYIIYGASEYLAAINALLALGARPELDERWKSWDWTDPESPELHARCSWLADYIDTWDARRAAGDRTGTPDFDYAL